MELHDKLEEKFRLDTSQKKALHRLNIFSVADLLFHFPVRYSDVSAVLRIANLIPGEAATIYGKVSNLKIKKNFRSKSSRAEGTLQDFSGKIKIVWFNQPYLAKMIKNDDTIKLSGKAIKEKKGGIYLANPEFEKIPHLPIDLHDTLFKENTTPAREQSYDRNSSPADKAGYPVYPETKGITSRWFYHAIEKILREKTLDKIEDYMPADIRSNYHLPALKTALVWIHKPKSKKDAESAKKRFAFEEVFSIQLKRTHDKFEYRKNKSFRIKTNPADMKNFIKRFPFVPTNSQNKCVDTVLADMEKSFPMSRLLEGDVGSGKTAVAAVASFATATQKPFDHARGKLQSFGNLQTAYMAPTEILATQHFESFIKYFRHLPVNIGLITGSGCRKFPSKINPDGWTAISRAQLLKWVSNGEIPILIGTHALIQKSVKFKNLALVVIDEQHRFGTAQRRKLVRKDGIAPHLLSMTATPIPRTLALTIYGDLDLSLLDEMPAGRKEIITEIITPDKRHLTYEQIRKELKAGRQAYVICPRIFEADPKKELALNVKSATEEAKRLKKDVFPEYETGVLHSKMSKEKKEKVMKDFSEGRIHILCATSVVEVGVNVPNATVIIIEGAERFGLAQLHQLRGRVIRSSHQAFCFIFADAKSTKTIDRLKALKTAKNGFELAELDLVLRGAGELGGGKQWGISDLGMEAIKNQKMVEAARFEATRLIEQDPELREHPLLKEKVRQKTGEFHFE